MQRLRIIIRIFLPRLQDILLIIVFIGALINGPRMLNTDSDIGRHLTLGKYIIRTHQIPSHDILSSTKAGQSRPPYEWLAQVIFAISYGLIGLDGVVILTAILLAICFWITYSDSVGRSRAPILSLFITALAVIASSLHWLTRPHIFSLVLFAIWLKWLERIRRGADVHLWFFPMLMLIWANTHGGFVYGLLAWAAYATGQLWESLKAKQWKANGKFLVIGGGSLVASFITPDGWLNWSAILNNRSSFVLSHTIETMPTNFALPGTWPFACMLLLSFLLIFFLWNRIAPAHFFLIIGFGIMSVEMARNIPFFSVVSVPILARWLSFIKYRGSWRQFETRISKLDADLPGYVFPALLATCVLGFFVYYHMQTGKSIYQFDPGIYPVQAADWITSHNLEGNMYNSFNWGGYLLYRLWPEHHVFIDSQSDFYGEELTRLDEEILHGGDNWSTALANYHIKWIIIPRGTDLAAKAQISANWHVVYHDKLTIIFVQSTSGSKGTIP